MQIWPGRRYPLGATYDGTGTNFALFSEMADAVELCQADAAHAVMVFLNGEGMPWMGSRGEPVTDDSFLLCFNAWHQPLRFAALSGEYGSKWRVLVGRHHAGRGSATIRWSPPRAVPSR